MWSILIRIGGGDLLTLSSRFVWLALSAIFVMAATLSFFITLGVVPAATSISQSTPLPSKSSLEDVNASSGAPVDASGQESSRPKTKPSEASPSNVESPPAEATPTNPPEKATATPSMAPPLMAVDARMMFIEIGSATSWGFYNPSNRAGYIVMKLDSQNKLDTTILMKTCSYVVDGVRLSCPRGEPDRVLRGGGWASPFPFVIDLTNTNNLEPKEIVIEFDTFNSAGTYPVKIKFTFAGWK